MHAFCIIRKMRYAIRIPFLEFSEKPVQGSDVTAAVSRLNIELALFVRFKIMLTT